MGLPLAVLHPGIRVLLLDVSEAAVAIARQRVAAAGLGARVECRVGRVEDFLLEQEQEQEEAGSSGTTSSSGGFHPFHLGVALHACGPATDLSMEAMLRARAAFVLCPCCVGTASQAERPSPPCMHRSIYPSTSDTNVLFPFPNQMPPPTQARSSTPRPRSNTPARSKPAASSSSPHPRAQRRPPTAWMVVVGG